MTLRLKCHRFTNLQ